MGMKNSPIYRLWAQHSKAFRLANADVAAAVDRGDKYAASSLMQAALNPSEGQLMMQRGMNCKDMVDTEVSTNTRVVQGVDGFVSKTQKATMMTDVGDFEVGRQVFVDPLQTTMSTSTRMHDGKGKEVAEMSSVTTTFMDDFMTRFMSSQVMTDLMQQQQATYAAVEVATEMAIKTISENQEKIIKSYETLDSRLHAMETTRTPSVRQNHIITSKIVAQLSEIQTQNATLMKRFASKAELTSLKSGIELLKKSTMVVESSGSKIKTKNTKQQDKTKKIVKAKKTKNSKRSNVEMTYTLFQKTVQRPPQISIQRSGSGDASNAQPRRLKRRADVRHYYNESDPRVNFEIHASDVPETPQSNDDDFLLHDIESSAEPFNRP